MKSTSWKRPKLSKSRYRRMYVAQKGLCHYCKQTMLQRAEGLDREGPASTTVDHVIPIGRCGSTHRDNIVLACRACNERKLDLLHWEWEPPVSRRKPYDALDMLRVLRLMGPRPDYADMGARPIVQTEDGADWVGRPEAPAPPPDLLTAQDWNEACKARDRHDVYHRLWPKIPRRLFRRLVSRGYVAEEGGVFWITEEGHRELRDKKRRSDEHRRYQRGRPIQSPSRRSKQRRKEAAARYVAWYMENNEGAPPLPRWLRSFGLSPKAEKQLMRRAKPKKQVRERPTMGRRKGWRDRYRRRHTEIDDA